MTTQRRHPLRPVPSHRAVPTRPRASRTSVPVPDTPVAVDWNPVRSVYAAVCGRCADHTDTLTLETAHEWADRHECDAELAALLTDITRRAAA